MAIVASTDDIVKKFDDILTKRLEIATDYQNQINDVIISIIGALSSSDVIKALSKIKDGLNSKNVLLQSSLRGEQEDYISRIEKLEHQIEDQTKGLKKVTKHVANILNQFDTSVNNTFGSSFTEFRTVIETLERDISRLEVMVMTAKSFDDQKKITDEFSEELDKINLEKTSLTVENEKLKQRISSLEKENTLLLSDSSKNQKENINLKKTVTDLTDENTTKEIKLTELLKGKPGLTIIPIPKLSPPVFTGPPTFLIPDVTKVTATDNIEGTTKLELPTAGKVPQPTFFEPLMKNLTQLVTPDNYSPLNANDLITKPIKDNRLPEVEATEKIMSDDMNPSNKQKIHERINVIFNGIYRKDDNPSNKQVFDIQKYKIDPQSNTLVADYFDSWDVPAEIFFGTLKEPLDIKDLLTSFGVPSQFVKWEIWNIILKFHYDTFPIIQEGDPNSDISRNLLKFFLLGTSKEPTIQLNSKDFFTILGKLMNADLDNTEHIRCTKYGGLPMYSLAAGREAKIGSQLKDSDINALQYLNEELIKLIFFIPLNIVISRRGTLNPRDKPRGLPRENIDKILPNWVLDQYGNVVLNKILLLINGSYGLIYEGNDRSLQDLYRNYLWELTTNFEILRTDLNYKYRFENFEKIHRFARIRSLFSPINNPDNIKIGSAIGTLKDPERLFINNIATGNSPSTIFSLLVRVIDIANTGICPLRDNVFYLVLVTVLDYFVSSLRESEKFQRVFFSLGGEASKSILITPFDNYRTHTEPLSLNYFIERTRAEAEKRIKQLYDYQYLGDITNPERRDIIYVVINFIATYPNDKDIGKILTNNKEGTQLTESFIWLQFLLQSATVLIPNNDGDNRLLQLVWLSIEYNLPYSLILFEPIDFSNRPPGDIVAALDEDNRGEQLMRLLSVFRLTGKSLKKQTIKYNFKGELLKDNKLITLTFLDLSLTTRINWPTSVPIHALSTTEILGIKNRLLGKKVQRFYEEAFENLENTKLNTLKIFILVYLFQYPFQMLLNYSEGAGANRLSRYTQETINYIYLQLFDPKPYEKNKLPSNNRIEFNVRKLQLSKIPDKIDGLTSMVDALRGGDGKEKNIIYWWLSEGDGTASVKILNDFFTEKYTDKMFQIRSNIITQANQILYYLMCDKSTDPAINMIIRNDAKIQEGKK